MKSLIGPTLAVLLLVACSSAQATTESSGRPLGPGERWLPLAQTDILCTPDNPIGGPRGTLMGSPDDPRLAWMLYMGQRDELAWPSGYTARFDPGLQILDATGTVVARAGDDFNHPCNHGSFWTVDTASLIPPAD